MHVFRRRILTSLLLLIACAFCQGASRPAPSVRCDQVDVARFVEGELSGRPAAPVEDWVRRAWSALVREGWPRARMRADTLAAGDAWTLELDSGPRTRLGSLDLRGPDPDVTERWRQGAELDLGDPVSPAQFEVALDRGLKAVSDLGYPLVSATVVTQQYDEESG